MATAGPNGGTGAGAGWTNPTNIASTNAVYATQSIPATSDSTQLNTSSMGFALPAATVNGIQTDIVRHASSNASLDFGDLLVSGNLGVSLSKTAGTPTGTAKLDTTAWGTTDGTTTLGSGSDLWGTTWSTSQVNATGFGVVCQVENNAALARTASIDSILVTVTYTATPVGTTAKFFAMFRKLFGMAPKRSTQARRWTPELGWSM